ncbi:M14 family zinc carboxypeptidase [Actinoplanes sp. NPDC051411]|uniref:M14 family zinc carboxypeptidase n=1 Tax=Actinoplanes sp. NPDC051411 TaxID=3155522 RepID=UPI00343F9FAD
MNKRRSVRSTLSVMLIATSLSFVQTRPAHAAAEPNQVTNVTVSQADGFTTVAWTPVDGATDYQIERTGVDASDSPVSPPTVVGVWRPNRQVNNGSPTFADSGFNPGERFEWRVRARIGTAEQPYSTPVFGTTLPPSGDPAIPGQNLRTQWETTQAAQFTSDVNEFDYTAAVDRMSDRVRVVEIGRTVQGRPINMFVIGLPAPPATPAAVAKTSPVAINCNVHGNEPSDREACLIMARQLAFGTDARTLDLLRNTTVLIIPSINGDGRAANSRGNSTGQDLNRDYSLIRQPETAAYVRMLRDYRPVAGYDGHEFGNNQAGDLPMLPPRHQNVAQSIFDESLDMIENHMYVEGAKAGWWPCPYGCQNGGAVGLSEETILRNTLGLKNTVNSLLELRSAGGPTRPDEANAANNRRRKTFSALWTFNSFLDFHRAQLLDIRTARSAAIQFQSGNTGRIVFRGSRIIPAHPAPHPGEAPPPADQPGPDQILDNAPCAYKLTDKQYNGGRTDGPDGIGTTVAQRIADHGWKVVKVADGFLVPLAQPERGLIPLLLDGQAAEPWVSGERVFPALTGPQPGPLTVTGFACLSAATVNGAVTVRPGGTLIATGSTLGGPLTTDNAAGVFLGNTMVRGTVRVSRTAGPVSLIGSPLLGQVTLADNTDRGAPYLAGNTIASTLSCTGNEPAPIDLEVPNKVIGAKTGQCVAF